MISWTKIFQTDYHDWRLKLETFKYINNITLHPLVSKVEDQNMERFKIIKKMKKSRRWRRLSGKQDKSGGKKK